MAFSHYLCVSKRPTAENSWSNLALVRKLPHHLCNLCLLVRDQTLHVIVVEKLISSPAEGFPALVRYSFREYVTAAN